MNKVKSSSSNDAARDSRRKFAKSVAAALVVAAGTMSRADAQTPAATTKEAAAPPNPQTTPTPAPATAASQPKPSPVAEAYAEVARARFGDKLSPEELSKVKSDLDGNVRSSERLRAVKLKNADEPDFVFGA